MDISLQAAGLPPPAITNDGLEAVVRPVQIHATPAADCHRTAPVADGPVEVDLRHRLAIEEQLHPFVETMLDGDVHAGDGRQRPFGRHQPLQAGSRALHPLLVEERGAALLRRGVGSGGEYSGDLLQHRAGPRLLYPHRLHHLVRLDVEFHPPVGGPPLGGAVVRHRLVGTTTDDGHRQVGHGELLHHIAGHAGGPLAGKFVVVAEPGPPFGADDGPIVAVPHHGEPEVALVPHPLHQDVQHRPILRVQLGAETVEPDAQGKLEQPPCHLYGLRRREPVFGDGAAPVLPLRGVEQQHRPGAHRLARLQGIDACAEADLLPPAGRGVGEPPGERAATHFRLPGPRRALWKIAGSVGKHHHQPQIAQRRGPSTQVQPVLHHPLPDLRVARQLQPDAALLLRLEGDPEIGPPQCPLPQLQKTRPGTPGEAGVALQGDHLILRGQGLRIQLKHMRTRTDTREMVLSLLVGDRIAAILQVETDSRQLLLPPPLSTILRRFHRHPSHQDGATAHQLLVNPGGDTRLVGDDGPAVAAGAAAADHLAGPDGPRGGDVTDMAAAVGGKVTQMKDQLLAIGRDLRIGEHGVVQAGAAPAVTEAGGQPVGQPHVGDGLLHDVLHLHPERQQVAGRHAILAGAAPHEQQGIQGIEGDIQIQRRADQKGEGLAPRARPQHERPVGQAAHQLVRLLRGPAIAGPLGGHHHQAVAARGNQWETVLTGTKFVPVPAAVGDAVPGDHSGGVTAHPVVTIHGGGPSGVRIDQVDRIAVQQGAAVAVEQPAERVHQRRRSGSFGEAGVIGIARLYRFSGNDVQHPVVPPGSGLGHGEVSGEHTAVRRGLQQAQRLLLVVIGNRQPHLHRLLHRGIPVLVPIAQTQEQDLSVLEGLGRLQRQGCIGDQLAPPARHLRSRYGFKAIVRTLVGGGVDGHRLCAVAGGVLQQLQLRRGPRLDLQRHHRRGADGAVGAVVDTQWIVAARGVGGRNQLRRQRNDTVGGEIRHRIAVSPRRRLAHRHSLDAQEGTRRCGKDQAAPGESVVTGVAQLDGEIDRIPGEQLVGIGGHPQPGAVVDPHPFDREGLGVGNGGLAPHTENGIVDAGSILDDGAGSGGHGHGGQQQAEESGTAAEFRAGDVALQPPRPPPLHVIATGW